MTFSVQDSETAISKEEVKSGRTYVQWLLVILVATTLFNYGLQNGWMSPMKKVLQSDTSPTGTPLTDAEISWIASVMPMAAVFGTSLYSYIADTFGRKIGIIAMIVPQALCWIIKLASPHFAALVVARIFAGLPAGGCFNLVPMYVKEISQDNIRGILVALAMTFTNIGYLTMYAMGGYLKYNVILWIVVCVPIASAILFIAIAPESPAYLVKKGKIEEAAKTVANLRGLDVDHKIVKQEMEYMQNQEEYFRTMKSISFVSIFKNKAWLRGFLLCMFILTVLDLNGTLSINTYAWTIMTQSGVTFNLELQTLSIPAIMILGSVAAITCVERFGRKPILVGALALATVSQTCLATTLLLQSRGDVIVPSWVPVLAIIVSVWAYAAGIMPMSYVILSEVFNFQVRAKLLGVIVTYAWFVSFVQVFSYHPITNNFGMYTTFYVFASVNFVGAVVCLIFTPETMGKSVEEIELMLLDKKK